jgi:hypothetical protein
MVASYAWTVLLPNMNSFISVNHFITYFSEFWLSEYSWLYEGLVFLTFCQVACNGNMCIIDELLRSCWRQDVWCQGLPMLISSRDICRHMLHCFLFTLNLSDLWNWMSTLIEVRFVRVGFDILTLSHLVAINRCNSSIYLSNSLFMLQHLLKTRMC